MTNDENAVVAAFKAFEPLGDQAVALLRRVDAGAAQAGELGAMADRVYGWVNPLNDLVERCRDSERYAQFQKVVRDVLLLANRLEIAYRRLGG